MRNLKTALALSAWLALATAHAQQGDTKRDNSRENKRDRDAGRPTADQQKMNAADEELTRKIRQAIMAEKSLSTYAHNVKIITQDGQVTMKGPVRSEKEKRLVLGLAVKAAGQADKVTNQITITPGS
jgi:hyperosmotically inducible periplasmic protein